MPINAASFGATLGTFFVGWNKAVFNFRSNLPDLLAVCACVFVNWHQFNSLISFINPVGILFKEEHSSGPTVETKEI